VGMATPSDIIKFVAEGLRTSGGAGKVGLGRSNEGRKGVAQELVLSYLALGVVLSVFPQLEALETPRSHEKLVQAVIHIIWSFQVDCADPMMQRIRQSQSGDLTVAAEGTISQFLMRELSNRMPDHAEHLEQRLAAANLMTRPGEGSAS